LEKTGKSNQSPQKIYRSRAQRVIAGVCGGMAEYFNIDVLLVRLAWIFAILFAGTGILAYIVCIFLIPDNPDQEVPEKKHKKPGEASKFWGIILIIIGALFLIQQSGIFYNFHFWHIQWQAIIAFGFIALGVYIIMNRNKEQGDTAEEGNESSPAASGKIFYRIEQGKMLSGVCTGLAHYFSIDVTLMRLLWVFLTLASGGLGILAYIIAVIVLPIVPDESHYQAAGEKQ
jgi:phage shock protein C